MSRITPAREPEPVQLGFTFELSHQWIDRHIVEHGTAPATRWKFEFELTELDDPALRARFLSAHRQYTDVPGYPTLERPTDDPVTCLAAVEEWLAGEQRAAADPFADEMDDWIASHGSPRLRTAHERGYKTNATYARERAALEFPLYWADTNESGSFRERTDPTGEALALETDARREAEEVGQHPVSPRIVWLLRPPSDLARSLNERGVKFAPCEAIHIPDYLGRYSLYLPLPYPREEE